MPSCLIIPYIILRRNLSLFDIPAVCDSRSCGRIEWGKIVSPKSFHQSCPLSPFLYVNVLETFLHNLKVLDGIIIWHYHHSQVLCLYRQRLHVCNEYCRNWRHRQRNRIARNGEMGQKLTTLGSWACGWSYEAVIISSVLSVGRMGHLRYSMFDPVSISNSRRIGCKSCRRSKLDLMRGRYSL